MIRRMRPISAPAGIHEPDITTTFNDLILAWRMTSRVSSEPSRHGDRLAKLAQYCLDRLIVAHAIQHAANRENAEWALGRLKGDPKVEVHAGAIPGRGVTSFAHVCGQAGVLGTMSLGGLDGGAWLHPLGSGSRSGASWKGDAPDFWLRHQRCRFDEYGQGEMPCPDSTFH
jgi:hypothetical protein